MRTVSMVGVVVFMVLWVATAAAAEPGDAAKGQEIFATSSAS